LNPPDSEPIIPPPLPENWDPEESAARIRSIAEPIDKEIMEITTELFQIYTYRKQRDGMYSLEKLFEEAGF
jgi:hypothetical protein